MKEIVLALFQACVMETVPNPHTVENLTVEQKTAIAHYTKWKCDQVVAASACSEYYKRHKKIAIECKDA